MTSALHKSSETPLRFRIECLLLLLWAGLPAGVQAQFNVTTNEGSVTISQYTGLGGNVVIPDTIDGMPVTAIGSQAFFQVSGLTSVTMGTNLTRIEANAIFQCPNLSSVSILGNVTNIGDGPFIDCKSLTGIGLSSSNLNYSVTNGMLFNKTQTSLIEFPGGLGGSYVLPAAVTNVGEAFIGNSLSAIVADPANSYYSSTNGVLFDKSQTFLISYPGGLSGPYTIPGTVSTIVSAAFEYSTGVSKVTIGTNVTSIGPFALYDCGSLAEISVDPTNAFYTSINGVLFDKSQSTLIQFPSSMGGKYAVPETVANIGDGAFGDAFTLTSVSIPNSVTNIGVEAFYSCQALADVTLGAKVSNIDRAAFFFCTSLTSVVLPGSVTKIGFEAFAGCQNLSHVCFEGDAPTDGGSIFFFDRGLSAISHVAGKAGWGSSYDGLPAMAGVGCGGAAPQLSIVRQGGAVVLTWPADFTTYTLEFATNISAGPSWTALTPLPVVVAGQNSVIDPIIGTQKFYRLSQ